MFSLLLCGSFIPALESYIEKENICILDEKVLKTFYRELQVKCMVALDEQVGEKAGALIHPPNEGFGLLGMLFEYTDWNILVGSFAHDLYTTVSSEKEIYKCTAVMLKSGRVVLLDFLEIRSLSELSRIVRYSVYSLVKQDITGSNPQIVTEQIKAVRPPYDEWGMVIYR